MRQRVKEKASEESNNYFLKELRRLTFVIRALGLSNLLGHIKDITLFQQTDCQHPTLCFEERVKRHEQNNHMDGEVHGLDSAFVHRRVCYLRMMGMWRERGGGGAVEVGGGGWRRRGGGGGGGGGGGAEAEAERSGGGAEAERSGGGAESGAEAVGDRGGRGLPGVEGLVVAVEKEGG
ncbi:hypothetical protein CYMTET_28532 [Cymbomonas tetramitiformis]|uniref:Uncharacterized protein n=1 Tax=Cymbomonas tetramitiformis TaxID=36881 RepID=A0AAE0FN23_9CHLO|nr:hypothetical protein CYMTET_28532 [Cymbomonas tetramitiformis]